MRYTTCLTHGFLYSDFLFPSTGLLAAECADPLQPYAIDLPVLAEAFPKRRHIRFNLTWRSTALLQQTWVIPGIGIGRQAVTQDREDRYLDLMIDQRELHHFPGFVGHFGAAPHLYHTSAARHFAVCRAVDELHRFDG